MPQNYTYIDLFAGCGGLSLGLHNAGWKGLFAIEKSHLAFKTLEHNLINKKQHFTWPDWLPKSHLEIDTVLANYQDELIKLQGNVDLVVGGPPCQGFSSAGLRKENDIRNGLISSYLKFIALVKPKMILFENVKGFTLDFKKNKSKGIAYAKYVVDELQNNGYDVEGKMVDFSKYGIPQKRMRFILVGVRKDVCKLNQLTASKYFSLIKENKKSFLTAKNLPQNPTVGNAINDLLMANGSIPCPDRNNFRKGIYSIAQSNYQRFLRSDVIRNSPDSHSFAKHSEIVSNRLIDLLKSQRPNKNVDAAFRKKYNLSKHTIIPLQENGVSPTITTLPDDYVHYCEPRILTVREYARIQSFPDWYEFKGKYTTGGKARTKETPRYTQIGNAIPPLFAEQSGLVLKKLL